MLGDAVGTTVPARAALAGAPSDRFGGVVLTVPVPLLRATVEVVPAREFTVTASEPDERWRTVRHVVRHSDRHGHVEAPMVLRAAVVGYARYTGWDGPAVEVRWASTIPRSVGLGWASALAVGAVGALGAHSGLILSPGDTAELAWTVLSEELGLTEVARDLVAQSTGRPVCVDLAATSGCEPDEGVVAAPGARSATGAYRVVEPARDLTAYVAWAGAPDTPGREVAALRERHTAGSPQVSAAMRELASIAVTAAWALEQADVTALAEAVDAAASVRQSLGAVAPGQLAVLDAARAVGASADLTGSGGALVGTPGPGGIDDLVGALEPLGYEVAPLTLGGGTQVPL